MERLLFFVGRASFHQACDLGKKRLILKETWHEEPQQD